MGNAMVRVAMLAVFLLGIAFPLSGQAQVQGADVPMSEMPVLVLYCEQDPGGVNPAGGRGRAPGEHGEFGCRPAEGVALTFRSERLDWFGRCDTDDDGECEITTPTGPPPEYELEVAVHMATVEPSFAPETLIGRAANFTEFAGYGLVLLPDDGTAPPDGPVERAPLAVNVAVCEDESNAEGCEREPTKALVQASPGEITAEGYPWLATNDEGWVSFDRASLEGETIDLILQTDRKPRFACTDLESGKRLETEWIKGREGNFIRLTPISDGEITCDVTLLGAPA